MGAAEGRTVGALEEDGAGVGFTVGLGVGALAKYVGASVGMADGRSVEGRADGAGVG